MKGGKSVQAMKGRAIKAPSRRDAPLKPSPAKAAPKVARHPDEADGSRGDVEIHRTGPRGEVNILRLDSKGETMLLEKGDMMRMYDDDGNASAEIMRLDTGFVGRPEAQEAKGPPTLGPLAVEGKAIVASSAKPEPDIMRIHTSEDGNMLWMQGAEGGTPMFYPSSPGDFASEAGTPAGLSAASPSAGAALMPPVPEDAKPAAT